MSESADVACERCAFYRRKLAEARDELTRTKQANRLYGKENEKLWNRYYEDERTIARLKEMCGQ